MLQSVDFANDISIVYTLPLNIVNLYYCLLFIVEKVIVLLNENEKFFFLHVPRSGGSSIELAFGLNPPNVPFRHHSMQQLKERYSLPLDTNALTLFTSVRNIYSRLCSTYRFKTVLSRAYNLNQSKNSFEDYINAIYDILIIKEEAAFNVSIDGASVFRNVRLDNEQNSYHNYYFGENHTFIFSLMHVRPLYNWLAGYENQFIYLDFNNLELEFNERIIHRSDIHASPLTHWNKIPAWAEEGLTYNQEMLKKVEEIYSWEIEKFKMLPPKA